MARDETKESHPHRLWRVQVRGKNHQELLDVLSFDGGSHWQEEEHHHHKPEKRRDVGSFQKKGVPAGAFELDPAAIPRDYMEAFNVVKEEEGVGRLALA